MTERNLQKWQPILRKDERPNKRLEQNHNSNQSDFVLTGADILKLGFKPAPWFGKVLSEFNTGELNDETLLARCQHLHQEHQTKHTLELRHPPLEPMLNFNVENEADKANFATSIAHMREIGKLPNVVAMALMPDACPVGEVLGTIPVGGVVAAQDAIFPSMHSSDVCCSLMATYFNCDLDPKAILDHAQSITHFGAGGRKDQFTMPDPLIETIKGNALLKPDLELAKSHFGTQGDGNHFLYLGRVQGGFALVTHHGSRGFGAALYKKGIQIANEQCKGFAHKIPGKNAWIDANSKDGKTYWDALQIMREWTKQNHIILHDKILEASNATIIKRFWNEHNFVFKRADLYLHAKGATPAYDGFAEDTQGLTLIPLNMTSPILVTRGQDSFNALGFAPHGAGRNLSRRKFEAGISDKQALLDTVNAQIDARWFSGVPDISETPTAYKAPAFIRSQIKAFNLCEIVQEITPLGGLWLEVMLERNVENEDYSRFLIARLCQVEGNKDTVGFYWWLMSDEIKRKDKKAFLSTRSQEITSKTGFKYLSDEASFFLPVYLNHTDLIKAIENGDVSEALDPFKTMLKQLETAAPVFTQLLKAAEKEFKVKLLG